MFRQVVGIYRVVPSHKKGDIIYLQIISSYQILIVK